MYIGDLIKSNGIEINFFQNPTNATDIAFRYITADGKLIDVDITICVKVVSGEKS